MHSIQISGGVFDQTHYDPLFHVLAFGATQQEKEANARLIAAALDLLATLQLVVEINPALPMGVIEQCHAAIAKVIGEKS